MRLILFGAGASYGSESVIPRPPPLGSQLFALLRSTFPRTWGGISTELASQFTASFEVGMGAVLSSGSHDVPVLMQQIAMFFAQFRPGPGNAYCELIERLDRAGKSRDLEFASLNYECLLELCIFSMARSVEYFSRMQRSAARAVIVWKVHGSCNFLPGPEIVATRGVSFGAGVLFNTSVRAVDPKEVATYCTGDTSLYPAMAHYAPGKAVQIAQPVIQQIQASYAQSVESAESIAIVGVRPNMDDQHVWQPLSKARGHVIIVGDEGSARKWVSKYREYRPTTYLGAVFASNVSAIADAI